jgi:preprotein translocase subunit SecG
MIYRILITLLAIDSVFLVAAVLLQSGKGGGLAASFGGVTSSADAILGTRQAGNLLTKASWWCGGLFLGLAFLISLTGSRRNQPRSILDQTFTPAQTAPATTAPNTNVLPIQPVTPSTTAPNTSAPAGGNTKTTPPTKTKTP